MPTRQNVLNAIEAINDNGNNTAEELRRALTLLLEHGEENPPAQGGSNLETFDVSQRELKNRQGDASFGYSFRGLTKFYGNLTFNLEFENIDPPSRDFMFEISDEAASLFEGVGIHVGSPRLPFVVPMIFSNDSNHLPAILHIGFEGEKLLWLEVAHNFDNMDGKISVTSSIHFHLPENADR